MQTSGWPEPPIFLRLVVGGPVLTGDECGKISSEKGIVTGKVSRDWCLPSSLYVALHQGIVSLG